MKYLIADFVTEFDPKYKVLDMLTKSFEYHGERETDIKLNISEKNIKKLLNRMTSESIIDYAEEFAYATAFNRAIIKYGAMLVHSSAILYRGGAYLFAARSGVGKSTHTRLWQDAFGGDVQIINDDKPVVRIFEDKCIAYGTPFDGGSGIANNVSAPLKAVVFLERGDSNTVRKAETPEILTNLYFSTTKYVSKKTAELMLLNFEKLINLCDFYILTCNTDISAAYTARDAIVNNI